MAKPAIFWDRDGTLIEDPGYLSDPEQVRLLPGAAQALARLAEAGFENIITTNQSGIARGLLDEPALERIHRRLHELLAAEGARVEAIYYCPFLDGPAAVVECYRQASDLRKPQPGMLVKASLERDIDLAASWSIGDSLRDCQAGRAAGCRTILLTPPGSAPPARDKAVDFAVSNLDEAVETVLRYGRPEATPTAASPDGKPGPAPAEAHSISLLREILTFLRMVDRRQQTEDFSFLRLAGAVAQLMAVAALIWAVFGMVRGEAASQIVRLLLAILLQLMALTFLARK